MAIQKNVTLNSFQGLKKDSEMNSEWRKTNSLAELVSASIYKEIPKSSWIIVSLTSHKTILNCFIRQSAVAHFICSANIIRYAPCYFEFRTASSHPLTKQYSIVLFGRVQNPQVRNDSIRDYFVVLRSWIIRDFSTKMWFCS